MSLAWTPGVSNDGFKGSILSIEVPGKVSFHPVSTILLKDPVCNQKEKTGLAEDEIRVIGSNCSSASAEELEALPLAYRASDVIEALGGMKKISRFGSYKALRNVDVTDTKQCRATPGNTEGENDLNTPTLKLNITPDAAYGNYFFCIDASDVQNDDQVGESIIQTPLRSTDSQHEVVVGNFACLRRGSLLVEAIQAKDRTADFRIIGSAGAHVSFAEGSLADFYYSSKNDGNTESLDVYIERGQDPNSGLLSPTKLKESVDPTYLPPPFFSRRGLCFPLIPYRFQENPAARSATRFTMKHQSHPVPGFSCEADLSDTALIPVHSRSHIVRDDFSMTEASKGVTGTYAKQGVGPPIARYSDVDVPPSSHTCLTSSISPVESIIMENLEEMFKERPVWLRTAIESRLGTEVSTWKKKMALARISYVIADGPWRGCLCRLGYDPRIDSSARIYQTVDFRDPYYRSLSWRTRKKRKESYRNSINSSFQSCPMRPIQLYQLCDIRDSAINGIVQSSESLNATWQDKRVDGHTSK